MNKINTWEEFHQDILELKNKFGEYRPDIIVPCMLGGLIPGAIIAKQMKINDVRPIDIERIGDQRRISYDIIGDIKGKKVLIIEDDITTGKGPFMVRKVFQEREAEVKLASVYVIPETKDGLDYYSKVYEKIPNYPWKDFHSGDKLRN